jgi:hypothetical protein
MVCAYECIIYGDGHATGLFLVKRVVLQDASIDMVGTPEHVTSLAQNRFSMIADAHDVHAQAE